VLAALLRLEPPSYPKRRPGISIRLPWQLCSSSVPGVAAAPLAQLTRLWTPACLRACELLDPVCVVIVLTWHANSCIADPEMVIKLIYPIDKTDLDMLRGLFQPFLRAGDLARVTPSRLVRAEVDLVAADGMCGQHSLPLILYGVFPVSPPGVHWMW